MTNIKVSLQYKVVKPDGTTLYVVPSPIRVLYANINGWIPITISFLFTWLITLIVLRKYYQRKGKLPVMFYCILILPIVFYLLGRTPDFYTLFTGHVFTFDNLPDPYLFRILFRIGVIGGSVLFGVSFFVISRSIAGGKIKDCITVAANRCNNDKYFAFALCIAADIWGRRSLTYVVIFIYV